MAGGLRAGFGATKPTPLGPSVCANPLPAGRYALEIFDKPKGAVRAFNFWAGDHSEVSIVDSRDIPAPSGMDKGLAVIFTVSKPVMWNQSIWGCPNVAPAKYVIDQLEPAPENEPGFWDSIFGKAGAGLSPPTWVYLGLGAVVLIALSPTLFEVSKIVAVHEDKS